MFSKVWRAIMSPRRKDMSVFKLCLLTICTWPQIGSMGLGLARNLVSSSYGICAGWFVHGGNAKESPEVEVEELSGPG